MDEGATVGLAWDDGCFAGFEAGGGGVAGVEAEAGFAFVCVLPVAIEAVFGEDGANVAIELDGIRFGVDVEGEDCEGGGEGHPGGG